MIKFGECAAQLISPSFERSLSGVSYFLSDCLSFVPSADYLDPGSSNQRFEDRGNDRRVSRVMGYAAFSSSEPYMNTGEQIGFSANIATERWKVPLPCSTVSRFYCIELPYREKA